MDFQQTFKFLLITFAVVLTGCMQNNPSLTSSAQTATESLGCDNLQSKVFDSMYAYLDEEKNTPDLAALRNELSEQIELLIQNQKITDKEKVSELKIEFAKIFDLLIDESKKTKNIISIKEHLRTLIELEMQDSSSSENINLNSKIKNQFSKVTSLSTSLNLECQKQTPAPRTAPVAVNAQSRMIAGQDNVFSTAYQSCQSLQIPEISASTADVVGISRIGTHEDGIGGVRAISNLSAVQNTHPYIRVAAGAQSGCYNVRANPLIYDYGGEPSVANNTINFFKNVGSGSATLGIDCSAYVSSAIAAAGFRYKAGVDNKAIYIRQSSEKFISAKVSGFSCFDNITLTKTETLKRGDIAGVRGHVVMVDKAGDDPFGIKKLSNVGQCASIDVSGFDFTISQSSPSKNGIGINKFIAKDYLSELSPAGKMRVLFTEMAKSACKAYFQNTSVKPANADWGIIRHNGKPECLAPRIQMTNQSCVTQCQN